jgi:hypothetical protein
VTHSEKQKVHRLIMTMIKNGDDMLVIEMEVARLMEKFANPSWSISLCHRASTKSGKRDVVGNYTAARSIPHG